jgi:hypothetical protein
MPLVEAYRWLACAVRGGPGYDTETVGTSYADIDAIDAQ